MFLHGKAFRVRINQKTCQVKQRTRISGNRDKSLPLNSVLKNTHSFQLRLVLFCIVVAMQFGFSQKSDTVISLLDVEVRVYRDRLEGVGKKQESFDSLQMQRFLASDVSKLLAQEAGVFIKNYGPGNIATTTLRGGNAAQTAVIWNGINIQNRLLGQLDFTQLPTFMFDNAGVDYGGSSAAWGSGAVAGSIFINNRTEFGKGKSLLAFLNGGSFEQAAGGFRYSSSEQFQVSTTRLFVNTAANNYLYKTNGSENLLQLQHANNQLASFMQEYRRLLGRGRQLAFNIWLNANNRLLPNYITNQSAATQKDKSIRSTLLLERYHRRTKSNAKLAALHDVINYSDSSTLNFNKSAVTSLIAELDNYFHYKKHVLNYAVNLNSAFAKSDAFDNTKTMHNAAVMLANRFNFFAGKILLQTNVRQELYSNGAAPFTFNGGMALKLKKLVVLQVNAAKVFRQPTFNELYWQPGGNTKLLPEKGYATDGSVTYNGVANNWRWSIEGTVFARLISNWILWLPGAYGQASPINVQQVFSRGSETKWLLSQYTKNTTVSLQIHSSYVLSTVRASKLPDDAAVGKQLIYTPRYSGNASLHLRYKFCFIDWLQQYAGYRFTASDNNAWLLPYSVTNVRLGLEPIKKYALQITLMCNNAFNTEYVVVASRPLPYRNYQLQVIYKIQNKQKINHEKN